jgi:hypothetical protein
MSVINRLPGSFSLDRDLRISLVGLKDLGEDWPVTGTAALANRCRYLIEERGFETWSPSKST